MKTKMLAALVVGVVACAGVRADGGSWEKFTSPNGNFSVLLPGTPTTQTKKMALPIGDANLTMHMAMDEDNRMYAVMTIDLPELIQNAGDKQDLLDGFVAGFVQPLKGKVVRQKDVKLGTYSGKDVDVTINEGQGIGRARAYVVKQRLYVIMTLATKGNAGDDVEKFLDSFRLGDD